MFSLALVTTMKATAAGQPGHRPLHGPPVAAQPLRGLDPLARDARDDVPAAEPPSQVVVVVPLVGVELGGPSPTWSTARADRRDTPYQGFHSQAVMCVRSRDADREGQTGPLGDQVDLRAFLAAIYGIRTRKVPPLLPACSPSQRHTATSSTRPGRRAHPAPGGEACPIPGPGSTPRTAGARSPQTGRSPTAAGATYIPSWPRRRWPPAHAGPHTCVDPHPGVAPERPAPLAETTPTTRPVPDAPPSPSRPPA